MTTQTKLDTLNAHLEEINDQRAEIRDGIQHTSERLTQAQHELAKIHADLKSGHDVEGDDLLTATRDVSDLEETLGHLQQQSGAKLTLLDIEAEKLRRTLGEVGLAARKAALSEAVLAYQTALRAALPLADEVRRAAAAAGVLLPSNAKVDSLILRRGIHHAGGIVLDLGHVPSGQSA